MVNLPQTMKKSATRSHLTENYKKLPSSRILKTSHLPKETDLVTGVALPTTNQVTDPPNALPGKNHVAVVASADTLARYAVHKTQQTVLTP